MEKKSASFVWYTILCKSLGTLVLFSADFVLDVCLVNCWVKLILFIYYCSRFLHSTVHNVFFFFFPTTDVDGVDLNSAQDTPVSTHKEDTYIHFDVDVEIQKHLEKLPKGQNNYMYVKSMKKRIL